MGSDKQVLTIRQMKQPQITTEGYEISTSRVEPLPMDKRYINTKMEAELERFKLRIAARYENREIASSYVFPRVAEQKLLSSSIKTVSI